MALPEFKFRIRSPVRLCRIVDWAKHVAAKFLIQCNSKIVVDSENSFIFTHVLCLCLFKEKFLRKVTQMLMFVFVERNFLT